MSPALLSKRLKELETSGVVRRADTARGTEYRLTEAGHDLEPVLRSLGEWSMRWVDHQCALANLDAQLLMWNMRRKINPNPLPARRVVVEFTYPELSKEKRHYWLIVSPSAGADLCSIDPGFDVDLYVTAGLKAMTSAWMGMSKMDDEVAAGHITFTGDPDLVRTLEGWMKLSSFAPK